MMGTFGSSMAGSMAGSMIGNAMFGGGSSQAAAPAPQPTGQYMPPQAPACTFESQQFLACMNQTYDNIDQCKSIFDQFKMCSMHAQMQMQQQPQQYQ